MELGEWGIRANAIAPGAVEGERIVRVFQGRAASSGKPIEEVKAEAMAAQSIKAMIDPRDIAALAVFWRRRRRSRSRGRWCRSITTGKGVTKGRKPVFFALKLICAAPRSGCSCRPRPWAFSFSGLAPGLSFFFFGSAAALMAAALASCASLASRIARSFSVLARSAEAGLVFRHRDRALALRHFLLVEGGLRALHVGDRLALVVASPFAPSAAKAAWIKRRLAPDAHDLPRRY